MWVCPRALALAARGGAVWGRPLAREVAGASLTGCRFGGVAWVFAQFTALHLDCHSCLDDRAALKNGCTCRLLRSQEPRSRKSTWKCPTRLFCAQTALPPRYNCTEVAHKACGVNWFTLKKPGFKMSAMRGRASPRGASCLRLGPLRRLLRSLCFISFSSTCLNYNNIVSLHTASSAAFPSLQFVSELLRLRTALTSHNGYIALFHHEFTSF